MRSQKSKTRENPSGPNARPSPAKVERDPLSNAGEWKLQESLRESQNITRLRVPIDLNTVPPKQKKPGREAA